MYYKHKRILFKFSCLKQGERNECIYMRKIFFAIGNRAHYARVKPIITILKNNVDFKIVVYDSAIYTLSDILINDGYIKKCIFLDTFEEGANLNSMTKCVGNAIIKFSDVITNYQPDIMVVIADRYEILAPAIAARLMNICLVHIQGGELTGTIDDAVRHTVSKLSNYHFVSNEKSKDVLINIGENKKNIFITGCPTIDLLENNKKEMREKSAYFLKKLNFNENERFILVNYHPETTDIESNYTNILKLYEKIKEFNMKMIWLEPNCDAGSDKISNFIEEIKKENSNIVFIKNLEATTYLGLVDCCSCIIGNSSVGIREASYLGTPSISIGSRQQNRQVGENVIRVSNKCEKLIKILNMQINHGKYKSSYLYGNGHACENIAELLEDLEIKNVKFYT